LPKKKAVKQAKPEEFVFTQGNELKVIATLLLKVCNKLDEMRNHTAVLVEQNEELLKRS